MMQRQERRQDERSDCETLTHEKVEHEIEKEDWISRVPDEIIIRILSLLTVKEAQMTSVLSTRWRHLWKHINCLNFGNIGYLESSERINWVNKVCSSIQSPRIEEFRMIFNLEVKAKDNVDKWVDFAMEKGVKDLELVMSSKYPLHYFDRYIFSYPANNTVSSGITNYKHYLRSLTLWYINISGETLEHFLLHCQSLEQISILDSNHLKTLNVGVGGPLLSLKSLEIFYCPKLRDLKISAPKLSNFLYQGQKINLHVENTPLLCHVYIGVGGRLTWAFRALSSYLCQLQTLVLRLGSSFSSHPVICMDFQQSLKLSSLRELTVKVFGRDCENLLFILSFLKATPFLEKLKLESELYECEKLLDETIDAVCPHKHLKVLEIIGFNASPNLVEFVKYLSGAAPKLEKVVIDPYPAWKAFAPKCSRIVFVKKFTELSKKLLKSVISRTDFVFEIMD